ncbi:AraC family transcriptional regulator [Mucilaginibacter myungsuensis]|uniref:Helix-turn-helix domain-containing protein n=1 Tax=Mucilaginibacter myungsuensis TaxID=649104 RepID=A0A929L0U6_9SPHI|nr:AraC family transcriptional regulator [Mucilaginibacter myungsuensis]MBE9663503.1 helix-turn-helix domain-containing protein [Mucilaginibacter myungsuensis]MDN3600241.1 AraC family transcriptional regulator [Mucilaginibacter myungsuensis]
MRIFRENIVSPDNLFVVKEEEFKYNDFPFHAHPEFEIILILEGAGRRIVGDSVTEFTATDLCMFGANLPHTFFTKGMGEHEAIKQVVIQFHENFLGPGFFDREPFKNIKALLQRSSQGIVFEGTDKAEFAKKIHALISKSHTEIVIGLLDILHSLSLSEGQTLLSSPKFMSGLNFDESARMSKVYDHILEHYRRDITLDEVASIAYLSPSAFCRYFKKFTRKTLSEFLTDLRIGHACKLLQTSNLSISQVSLDAGFNSVSYFNRKFRAVKGETPMEYQRHFMVRRAN